MRRESLLSNPGDARELERLAEEKAATAANVAKIIRDEAKRAAKEKNDNLRTHDKELERAATALEDANLCDFEPGILKGRYQPGILKGSLRPGRCLGGQYRPPHRIPWSLPARFG